MTVTSTVKKVVADNTYVAVGATDLAVERVRTAREQLDALRAELAPKRVQERIVAAPADARDTYVDLAARGEKLVQRVRTQRSTRDLLGQAQATLALGKGLVTTARGAVSEVESSARATLTTGRKEAAAAATAVADSVTVDTDAATKAVEDSVKRTRTAAKRTTTTAKKRAARTRTQAKATGTSARRTAAKSTTATKKAAEKVGD